MLVRGEMYEDTTVRAGDSGLHDRCSPSVEGLPPPMCHTEEGNSQHMTVREGKHMKK